MEIFTASWPNAGLHITVKNKSYCKTTSAMQFVTSHFADWRTETALYAADLNKMTQLGAVLNVEHILSGDSWQMCAAEQMLR